MASLLKLPDEVLIEILQYLRIPDLLNTRLVCRRLWILGSDDRVLNVRFEEYITLQKLLQLFRFGPILENVTRLAIESEGEERIFFLHRHLEPIAWNCRKLSELSFYNVTLEEGICIAHLPPSLRALHLIQVTFGCDVRFFTCDTKKTCPKLEKLRIESMGLSCFGIIYCLNSSLTTLILKNIDQFSQLHFSLLKWKFPLLETLEVDCDVGREIVEVVSTFKKLKCLKLSYAVSGIKLPKTLEALDQLESMEIHDLDMSYDRLGEMPIFPRLISASFSLFSFDNEFCVHFVEMFPSLTRLVLGVGQLWHLPFLTLELFASHPKLAFLSLSEFDISRPDHVNLAAVRPPSRVTSLIISNCTIPVYASHLFGQYFANVTELRIELNFEYDYQFTGMLREMNQLKKVVFKGAFVTDLFLESVIPSLSNTVRYLSLDDDNNHNINYNEFVFGNRSMKIIANNVSSLRKLSVTSRKVGADGFLELFKLKNLVELSFNKMKISGDQLENLKEILPNVPLYQSLNLRFI